MGAGLLFAAVGLGDGDGEPLEVMLAGCEGVA